VPARMRPAGPGRTRSTQAPAASPASTGSARLLRRARAPAAPPARACCSSPRRPHPCPTPLLASTRSSPRRADRAVEGRAVDQGGGGGGHRASTREEEGSAAPRRSPRRRPLHAAGPTATGTPEVCVVVQRGRFFAFRCSRGAKCVASLGLLLERFLVT